MADPYERQSRQGHESSKTSRRSPLRTVRSPLLTKMPKNNVRKLLMIPSSKYNPSTTWSERYPPSLVIVNINSVFILTHEVTIKIKNIKGIGKLTDEIINAGEDLVTLQEFIWKADEVVLIIFRNWILRLKR
jgi:hypothetical protein